MYDSIHRSLLEIVGFINRPSQDDVLLRRAGVSLDSALFPLLVVVSHRQPIGVVELAGLVNKNYSTVSRQVSKLVELGLVAESQNKQDKRVRLITITKKGEKTIGLISEARRQLMAEVLRGWKKEEIIQLDRNLRHVAESLNPSSPDYSRQTRS